MVYSPHLLEEFFINQRDFRDCPDFVMDAFLAAWPWIGLKFISYFSWNLLTFFTDFRSIWRSHWELSANLSSVQHDGFILNMSAIYHELIWDLFWTYLKFILSLSEFIPWFTCGLSPVLVNSTANGWFARLIFMDLYHTLKNFKLVMDALLDFFVSD